MNAAAVRGAWDTIIIKLSGEALKGPAESGIHRPTVQALADGIASTADTGLRIGLIVGGGNIWRGSEVAKEGMERATADYAGMLATVINAIAMQDALERGDLQTRLQTAIEMREVAEPFIRRRATRHLDKGRLVIFAAGTGNPFFTTDTAAVLRATEIGAEAILKGTNVEGVYDDDPAENENAKLYETISHRQALEADLRVMDPTAFALAMENRLPIVVFNVEDPQNIRRAALGQQVGTLVYTPDGEQSSLR